MSFNGMYTDNNSSAWSGTNSNNSYWYTPDQTIVQGSNEYNGWNYQSQQLQQTSQPQQSYSMLNPNWGQQQPSSQQQTPTSSGPKIVPPPASKKKKGKQQQQQQSQQSQQPHQFNQTQQYSQQSQSYNQPQQYSQDQYNQQPSYNNDQYNQQQQSYNQQYPQQPSYNNDQYPPQQYNQQQYNQQQYSQQSYDYNQQSQQPYDYNQNVQFNQQPYAQTSQQQSYAQAAQQPSYGQGQNSGYYEWNQQQQTHQQYQQQQQTHQQYQQQQPVQHIPPPQPPQNQYQSPTKKYPTAQQKSKDTFQPIKKITTPISANTTATSSYLEDEEKFSLFKKDHSEKKLQKQNKVVNDWDTEPPIIAGKNKIELSTTTTSSSTFDNFEMPLAVKAKKQQQQSKLGKAKRKSEFDSPTSQNKRLQRFGNIASSAGTGSYSANNFGFKDSNDGIEVLDWDLLTIKGTCTNLEKQYLRLTSAPDPSTVRPEEVLKRSLLMLKKKWLEKGDYTYTCEQFRSIRQDLTVQRIKNRFTVEVYETHARLALENNDLGQFNQCQTQLFELYKQPGISSNSVSEFFAYRLLYNIYQDNGNDMIKTISDIDKEKNMSLFPHVKHALQVRTAIYSNNYCSYFKLSRDPPNMASYLLDKITPRIRIQALKTMMKSYRPNLLLSQIRDLGFNNDLEAKEYIDKYQLAWVDSKLKKEIDCKLSLSTVNQMEPPIIKIAAIDGRW